MCRPQFFVTEAGLVYLIECGNHHDGVIMRNCIAKEKIRSFRNDFKKCSYLEKICIEFMNAHCLLMIIF